MATKDSVLYRQILANTLHQYAGTLVHILSLLSETLKNKSAFSYFCEKVRICLLHYLSFVYICSINGKVNREEMPPGKTLFDIDKFPVQTDLFSVIN